ncbi:TetR family transcriptional regulator [Leucobacter allii]|uniref:TetR/AcrR family transcriptional regulator n=1 Tax=Leucobacter allii TaxID=2932247 RepID=UPI001FD54E4D|nr:TetR family transcriptional regulator [Leucobacter allii]UOR02328.1 TetR family transcriptional regulator [Leucobacter allii]
MAAPQRETERPLPGKRDPEGRRRAIVAAATELIVQTGPDSLTHRAVAERAGVSLGSTTQYFASLDELRETALTSLSDEIDAELDELERLTCEIEEMPDRIAQEMQEFLADRRAVRADIALLTSGIADPRLRELALRWPNRLIEILTPRFGAERATAIAHYLDGALIHTGLRGEPVPPEAMSRTIRAIAGLPAPGAGAGAAAVFRPAPDPDPDPAPQHPPIPAREASTPT